MLPAGASRLLAALADKLPTIEENISKGLALCIRADFPALGADPIRDDIFCATPGQTLGSSFRHVFACFEVEAEFREWCMVMKSKDLTAFARTQYPYDQSTYKRGILYGQKLNNIYKQEKGLAILAPFALDPWHKIPNDAITHLGSAVESCEQLKETFRRAALQFEVCKKEYHHLVDERQLKARNDSFNDAGDKAGMLPPRTASAPTAQTSATRLAGGTTRSSCQVANTSRTTSEDDAHQDLISLDNISYSTTSSLARQISVNDQPSVLQKRPGDSRELSTMGKRRRGNVSSQSCDVPNSSRPDYQEILDIDASTINTSQRGDEQPTRGCTTHHTSRNESAQSLCNLPSGATVYTTFGPSTPGQSIGWFDMGAAAASFDGQDQNWFDMGTAAASFDGQDQNWFDMGAAAASVDGQDQNWFDLGQRCLATSSHV